MFVPCTAWLRFIVQLLPQVAGPMPAGSVGVLRLRMSSPRDTRPQYCAMRISGSIASIAKRAVSCRRETDCVMRNVVRLCMKTVMAPIMRNEPIARAIISSISVMPDDGCQVTGCGEGLVTGIRYP